MSVPPSGGRPASTPPSKASPNSNGSQKDFKLPGAKEQVQDEGQKKKGLFDITADDIAAQTKQQGLSQDLEAAAVSVSQTAGVDAVAQVSQVAQLIQKMVGTMRIGQLDGKDFASLDLKAGPQVPEAFAGSNLTLSYQANSLAIHFDNFMTPQQQNTAINLVEQNKEQLLQMVEALNAKNIQVSELTIGTHTVNLPRVEPLPPPFQPTSAAQTGTGQQREQGDQGGQKKKQDK